MSESTPRAESVVLGPPKPPPKKRTSVVKQVYKQNPFYVISAMLMLASVRSVYGEMQIGTINCWIMMGVLAGYTALLALIGVLIVRWGKVWEDARSILLLLLVLFLAVSISADDLFANMDSSSEGWPLSLFGLLFSSIVTELVLRGIRIRFGWRYRIPLHLMYALFYGAPWFVSASLSLGSASMIAWRVFLFPVAAAGILLTLLPAVRGGPQAVENNGTPWRWPLYPWTAFVVIAGAVAVRTFAMCMTFGPTGPLWVRLSSGNQIINFDTMWGPYFLIPLMLAVLILCLEAGFVTANRQLVRRVLSLAPWMLVLALPMGGPVFRRFFVEFTTALGSPLWLASCLLIAFYAWAWWRGAASAEVGLLASGCLLTVVGPNTTGLFTLSDPQAWPLIVVGTITLIRGLLRRSTVTCLVSSGLLTFALWLVLPETPLAAYRMRLTAHVFWGVLIVLGFAFRDGWSLVLRLVGAAMTPVAGVLTFLGPWAADIPFGVRMLYLGLLTLISFMIAHRFRSRWYLIAFTSLVAIQLYGLATVGFRGTVHALGQAATTAALWSVGTLLAAVLISAHKAGWLQCSQGRLAADEVIPTLVEWSRTIDDAFRNGIGRRVTESVNRLDCHDPIADSGVVMSGGSIMTTPKFQTCPKCDRRSWRLRKCLQCGYAGPPGIPRAGVQSHRRSGTFRPRTQRPLFGSSTFTGLDLFDAVWAIDCADFASDIVSGCGD